MLKYLVNFKYPNLYTHILSNNGLWKVYNLSTQPKSKHKLVHERDCVVAWQQILKFNHQIIFKDGIYAKIT